jgi:hypothetical protein
MEGTARYSATFGLDQASGLGASSACLPDTGRGLQLIQRSEPKVGQHCLALTHPFCRHRHHPVCTSG